MSPQAERILRLAYEMSSQEVRASHGRTLSKSESATARQTTREFHEAVAELDARRADGFYMPSLRPDDIQSLANEAKTIVDDLCVGFNMKQTDALKGYINKLAELAQTKATHADLRVGDALDLVAIYAKQHAADIAALALRPLYAWCRMHVTPDNPSGPFETEPDFSYGDDQPEGDGWFPLYR